jgi:hypothetical protein
MVVVALTVAGFHLHVCLLHALRVVAINAAMGLKTCREVPYHEVHIRSHIGCSTTIQNCRQKPSRLRVELIMLLFVCPLHPPPGMLSKAWDQPLILADSISITP